MRFRVLDRWACLDDEDFKKYPIEFLTVVEPYPGYPYLAFKGKFLHRIVLKAPRGLMVDHINGNGLDNRKLNLRLVTNTQNQWNAHKIRGVSRFRNVTWSKKSKRWQARISVNGKRVQIGHFKLESDAARAVSKHKRMYEKEIWNTKGGLT